MWHIRVHIIKLKAYISIRYLKKILLLCHRKKYPGFHTVKKKYPCFLLKKKSSARGNPPPPRSPPPHKKIKWSVPNGQTFNIHIGTNCLQLESNSRGQRYAAWNFRSATPSQLSYPAIHVALTWSKLIFFLCIGLQVKCVAGRAI